MKIDRRYFILDIISELKPNVIIDIGTHNGIFSAMMIAAAGENIEYWGFDLWDDISDDQIRSEFLYPKDIASYQEAKQNIKRVLSEEKIHLVRGNTNSTLQSSSLPIADFIFIDGGHSAETIRSDWENCKRFMNHDTIVIFDDYWHGRTEEGCADIVDNISDEYEVSIFGKNNFVNELSRNMGIDMLRISLVKVRLKNGTS